MRRRAFVQCALVALLSLAAAALPALGGEDLLFQWDPRLWGGDVALGWKGWDIVPGVDTVLWGSVGGAWQNNLYFGAADDTVVPDRPDQDTIAYVNLNADWRFGAAQGIVFNPAQNRNLVEFLLFYRGKIQHYLYDNGVLDPLPERNGLLQHSLFTGLLFDNTTKDKASLNRRGIYSVLSAELAPAWLGNEVLGLSDYWRLSFIVTGYQPVLDTPAVSIYLADRVLFDRIFGNEVPVTALGSIGTLTEVPFVSDSLQALGDALRGVADNRYDGYVKLVNNFDVRLHFPAWTLFKLATPMAVAYFDAGVYDRMTRKLRFDPVYCAAGLGVGLYALGFDFILYGTYFLNERDLYYGLGLGVHF
jgi:hypothetical protein